MVNYFQKYVTFFLVFLLCLSSCLADIPIPAETRLPSESQEAITPSPDPTLGPTKNLIPTSMATERSTWHHPVGVRVVDGNGEFFVHQTGETFIPRGNNFIRLDWVGETSPVLYHSTFNVGKYDPQDAEAALSQMAQDGYNTVRVFLSPGAMGDPFDRTWEGYFQNLSDFLRKAQDHQIYVILTTDGFPGVGRYYQIQDTTWSEDFDCLHANYLRSGGVKAEIQFWKDLIHSLMVVDVPLEAIFAYALRNELFFDTNLPPLNLNSGSVTTANNQVYNMGSDMEKQQMMAEGLVYWIDQVRAGIRDIDPTALVGVGFFVPQAPNPVRIGDHRLSITAPAIWESEADFIDLHMYLGDGLTLAQFAENYGLGDIQDKPIIMGEFGSPRWFSANEGQVAQALHDWQIESCHFGFDGWLLWTWDTEKQRDFYNGLTGQGLINQVLAPINRPDPCQAGDFWFFEGE